MISEASMSAILLIPPPNVSLNTADVYAPGVDAGIRQQRVRLWRASALYREPRAGTPRPLLAVWVIGCAGREPCAQSDATRCGRRRRTRFPTASPKQHRAASQRLGRCLSGPPASATSNLCRGHQRERDSHRRVGRSPRRPLCHAHNPPRGLLVSYIHQLVVQAPVRPAQAPHYPATANREKASPRK